jgi:hypothetical protein
MVLNGGTLQFEPPGARQDVILTQELNAAAGLAVTM